MYVVYIGILIPCTFPGFHPEGGGGGGGGKLPPKFVAVV